MHVRGRVVRRVPFFRRASCDCAQVYIRNPPTFEYIYIAWEQCNHTRKNELNRYLVHALEQPPISRISRLALPLSAIAPHPLAPLKLVPETLKKKIFSLNLVVVMVRVYPLGTPHRRAPLGAPHRRGLAASQHALPRGALVTKWFTGGGRRFRLRPVCAPQRVAADKMVMPRAGRGWASSRASAAAEATACIATGAPWASCGPLPLRPASPKRRDET